MSLQATLRERAYTLGGDIFGVADLTPHQDALCEHYGDTIASFPRAICVGVFMPHPVIDELLEHPTHTYLTYYDTANAMLNQIGLALSNQLYKLGFSSYPIPASQRGGAEKDRAIFSHRLAARAAGLGWLGKSCNFIHPEVGPRLRLVTVLTDAPLICGEAMESRCGSCTKCMDICPAHAIRGVAYEEAPSLADRFDFAACDGYLSEMRQVFGKRICGRCVAVCPHGRRD